MEFKGTTGTYTVGFEIGPIGGSAVILIDRNRHWESVGEMRGTSDALNEIAALMNDGLKWREQNKQLDRLVGEWKDA